MRGGSSFEINYFTELLVVKMIITSPFVVPTTMAAIFHQEFTEGGSWYDGETCSLTLEEIEVIIQQFLHDHPREDPTGILDTDPREQIIELCEQYVHRS